MAEQQKAELQAAKAAAQQYEHYESEIEPEYTLEHQLHSAPPAPKANVAIKNPKFVDPGVETDNEYNKTHEMTRTEVILLFVTF